MLLLRRATAVGRPGVAASPLLRRAAPLPACRRPAVGAGLQQLRGLATDAGDKVVSAADKGRRCRCVLLRACACFHAGPRSLTARRVAAQTSTMMRSRVPATT
jgi:hypothetical protein|eukprot:COSAG06_NODE_263_length_18879_cov_71.911555_20_plen_103_part_00